MGKKQTLVRDIQGGSEVRSDGDCKRYYGVASAPFRLLVELFIAPFRYGVVFGRYILGTDGVIYRIILFPRGRAMLVEEEGE